MSEQVHHQLLAEFRPQMLKFARLQLQDSATAEDVVHEAIGAALAGANRFSGRSALKTWLFAILRHKIVDALRERGRTVPISSLATEEDALDAAFDALFSASAHWHPASRPQAWGDPEQTLAQREFWVAFETCLELLPANTARVFMMREFLGLETPEISRNLDISTGNCHVILHRARAALRLCLERGWFNNEGCSTC